MNPLYGWTTFSKSIRVPDFQPGSFAIAPLISIVQVDIETNILFKDIQLTASDNEERKTISKRISIYVAFQEENDQPTIPEELAWTHQNYVMGFIFMSDTRFWDVKKGKYLVGEHRTMDKEFGGIQSAIL